MKVVGYFAPESSIESNYRDCMDGYMEEEYDVMICGAGPTGVLLAAYLSRAGCVKVTKLSSDADERS